MLGHEEAVDFQSLMEEPPGGENHGFTNPVSSPSQGSTSWGRPRRTLNWKTSDRSSSGDSVVGGHELGAVGMLAHRGILQEGEYVDADELYVGVEGLLGEDLTEVKRIYGPGGLTEADRAKRLATDSKFLRLSQSGGNMSLLGKIIGFYIREDGHCPTMTRALQRAGSC